MRFTFFFCFTLFLLSAIPLKTLQANPAKDIQTIALALSFMDGMPKGVMAMDILYDPSNPESVAHANEIAAITKTGLGSKSLKLVGQKIADAGDISAKALFVTRGSRALHADILSRAQTLKAIPFSNHPACLGSACIFTATSDPKVDIFISISAAQTIGVEFSAAFAMMASKN